MGQKQTSTKTNSWTINDWAFGTGPNALQLNEFVDEARQASAKCFFGEQMQNDPSIHRMQSDFSAFDKKIKRLFFRSKKKNKAMTTATNEITEFYPENRFYYNRHSQTIVEEDETNLSSTESKRKDHVDLKELTRDFRWRCRFCTEENKSTDIDCRQCKEKTTRF